MIRSIFSGFIKTLKLYSLLEIILSAIFLVIFLYSLINIVSPPFNVSSKNVYIEGLVGRVSYLNPLFADMNEVDRDITRLIFSGLVKYYPDTQEFKPDLADYTVSDDKTLYTFTIKNGIKWHDNKDFTSQDVYFTFHDIIQSEDFQNPILKTAFSDILIEKKDDKTVAFKLKSPNSYFISELTIGILPYHVLKDIAVKNFLTSDFNRDPIGTGPFEISSYKTTSDNGSKITLAKFDDFYGKQPNIEHIVFLIFPKDDAIIKNIKEVNAVTKVPSEITDDLKKDSSIKLVPYALPQYTALFFNTDKGFVNKKEIRLGLAKSINAEELALSIPGHEFVNAGAFEGSYKDKFYRYSKEKAVKFLEDAGFKIQNKEQYRKNKKGEVLAINLVLRKYPQNPKMDSQMKQVGNFILKAWSEINVKTEVSYLDQDEFNEAIKNSDYDALIAGESFSYNMDMFSFWHSSQIVSKGGMNFSNYTNYSVDKLIEDARTAFNKDKRTQRAFQVIDNLREDMAVIFLFRPVYYYATDSKWNTGDMKNFVFSADRFWNVNEWKP